MTGIRHSRALRALAIAAAVAVTASCAFIAAGGEVDAASARAHSGVGGSAKDNDKPRDNSVAAIRGLNQAFTIAAIPDTQYYSEENDPGFAEQVKWLLANAAAKNVVFVTHLGDVVDNGTDTTQWANAMAALKPLLEQSTLPFSVVRGNHDDPGLFLQNLPLSLMRSKPWFVAASKSGLSQAQVFKVQKAWFLHIGFQKDPTLDELKWADALLERPGYKHMPAIVSTHDYIDGSGRSTTGRIMWDSFVKRNPTVFMVLNGHTHTEYALVNHNAAKRPVYQMLSDYQDRDNCGNGLMRLITIDPAQDKIFVKTFSPYYEGKAAEFYEEDADSRFEYAVNVNERLLWNTRYDFGPEPPPPPLPQLNAMPAAVPYTHVFQNRRPLVGTSIPYAGTVDVQINENNAGLNYGGEATLTTDMDDSGSRVHAMLRFDGIVGTGPGQIAKGSTIRSARLVFAPTSSTKGKVIMHRMLKSWSETSTWNDFTPLPVTWEPLTFLNTDTGIYKAVTLNVMRGGGIGPDGVEAMVAADATFTMPKPVLKQFVLQAGGMSMAMDPALKSDHYSAVYSPPSLPVETLTIDLTPAVQAWVDDPTTNFGWFFEPTSSDGWDFETAEGKQPPALCVEVEGAPLLVH